MTVAISQAHNEARLGGTLAHMDAGSGAARIRIYNGTRPAAGGTVTTLLVEIALDKPSGTIASGALTLAQAPGDLPMVANSGDASWARIVNGNGDWSWDCDVSAVGGAGEVQLLDTTLFAGGKVQLLSGVIG